MRVMAREGYAGATTKQIAAEANINEVTLFRRFGTKKNLLLAVVEQEVENFTAAGIQVTGELSGDLLRVVRFYQQLIEHRGNVLLLFLTEAPRQPELMELMSLPLSVVGRMMQLLAEYQQKGLLVQESPVQALAALVGPIFLEGIVRHVQPEMVGASLDPALRVERFLNGRLAS